MRHVMMISVLTALWGCGDDKAEETGTTVTTDPTTATTGTTTTGTTTTGTTATGTTTTGTTTTGTTTTGTTTTGTDCLPDATKSGPQALLAYSGSAVVTGDAFTSQETMSLVGMDDAGEDLVVCSVSYLLSADASAARSDCTDCSWAFDVAVSDVVVDAEAGSGCAAILCQLGLDEDPLVAFDGATKTYGYNPDFFGHAEILMTLDASGAWVPGGFAALQDDDSVTYTIEDGYYDY